MYGHTSMKLESFKERLEKFCSHWDLHATGFYGSSQAIVVETHEKNMELRTSKSSAFHKWLIGVEFPGIIIVLFKDPNEMHCVCHKNDVILLESLKHDNKIFVYEKEKKSNGFPQLNQVFNSRAVSTVGFVAPNTVLVDYNTKSNTQQPRFTLVDVSNGFSSLFAVKNLMEQSFVKKASIMNFSLIKHYVIPEFRRVISDNLKVTHSQLTEGAMKCMKDPQYNMKLVFGSEYFDICYPPLFQSGGEFKLAPSSSSTNKKLERKEGNVIICGISCSCNHYCSYLARTFFLRPTSQQRQAYQVLLAAQEAAISALVNEATAKDVYNAVKEVVDQQAPHLLSNLTKSVGTGMGLEFNESDLDLNVENNAKLKAGMVFNILVGFEDIPEDLGRNGETFSLVLADMFVVTNCLPSIVTQVPKAAENVEYPFKNWGNKP